MTVWEELLKVYKVKPTITNGKELNSFLIEATDWIADADNISDDEWDGLSIDLQKYVNECIAILDSVQLKDVKLDPPDGFTMTIPVVKNTERRNKTDRRESIEKVEQITVPTKVKIVKQKAKKVNANLGFESILKVLWDNPQIPKQDFINKFPEEKVSSLVLYRNIISRAFNIVQEWKKSGLV